MKNVLLIVSILFMSGCATISRIPVVGAPVLLAQGTYQAIQDARMCDMRVDPACAEKLKGK